MHFAGMMAAYLSREMCVHSLPAFRLGSGNELEEIPSHFAALSLELFVVKVNMSDFVVCCTVHDEHEINPNFPTYTHSFILFRRVSA
jgi:hypothetical protein